jgi:hypothetical protein
MIEPIEHGRPRGQTQRRGEWKQGVRRVDGHVNAPSRIGLIIRVSDDMGRAEEAAPR